MKKIIFISAFLFCVSIQAQYFMYGYNNVPDDEIEYFLQNETELFSKAAEKAFEKGIINGWSIMKRVQGAKSEPNFYWYIAVDDLKKLDALEKILRYHFYTAIHINQKENKLFSMDLTEFELKNNTSEEEITKETVILIGDMFFGSNELKVIPIKN